MNIEKIRKKITNIERVRWIVEIAKVDTLQKLTKATKVANHHYAGATLSKQIMSFGLQKLNMHYLNNIARKKVSGKLIIHISIPSTLIKVSHFKLNQILTQSINPKNDQVISIGSPSYDYVQEKKYNLLKYYENLTLPHELISIINHAISNNLYQQIEIIAMTPRLKNKPIVIYPFLDSKNDKKQFKNYKFYPSLSKNFSNIANTYVVNIVTAIYQEAYKLFYKEKLLKHEEALKMIDQKIDNWKQDIRKGNRKKETEELSQVSLVALNEQKKRGSDAAK